MPQNIFYPDLNTFCRKFFVAAPGVPSPDPRDLSISMYQQQAKLFENLLLFDKISFKITGEAIPVATLFSVFGEKAFDALIEQGAFDFVLWNQNVFFLEKNIPGVNSIAAGVFNNPEYIDPERSIDAGLRWMRDAPSGRKRRQFIKKLLPLFRVTEKDLAERSLKMVQTALRSGGLEPYSIPRVDGYADSLDDAQKRIVAKSAEDFMEYDYLIKNGMTSFSDYKYFSPFWSSAERFRTMNQSVAGFASIAKIEGIPDLKGLFPEIKDPLQRVADIRKTPNARNFRSWLEKTAGEAPDADMVRAYLDSIGVHRGFLNSKGGKVFKSVLLASVGVGAGSIIGGEAGAVVGGIAAPIVEKVAEVATESAIGFLDSFVLDRVTKGLSPRMFFDDLSQVRQTSGKGLRQVARHGIT